MNGDIRSQEASQIVQALAALPGGAQIHVRARKFPRFGPHVTGTTYQEETHSFPVGQLPASLQVPADAEEVSIQLRGSLQAAAPADLTSRLDRYFAENGLSAQWSVRGYVHATRPDGQSYELHVFM